MNRTVIDFWQQKREEPEPEPSGEPIEMTLAGMPCRLRPLSTEFYIRSGRMPAYLARIAMQPRNPEAVDKELAAVSAEDVLAGQAFQRAAVCRVLAAPRAVDVPQGQEPEGAFSYMELAERWPAFVDAVFFWVLLGCPLPRKEGEDEGLDAGALETFPESERRQRRSRARDNRKAHGKDAAGASKKRPART